MNKIIKLWKEYKKYVARINAPLKKAHLELLKADQKKIENWKLGEIFLPIILLPYHKESFEDFMDWIIENKKL